MELVDLKRGTEWLLTGAVYPTNDLPCDIECHSYSSVGSSMHKYQRWHWFWIFERERWADEDPITIQTITSLARDWLCTPNRTFGNVRPMLGQLAWRFIPHFGVQLSRRGRVALRVCLNDLSQGYICVPTNISDLVLSTCSMTHPNNLVESKKSTEFDRGLFP